MKTQAVIRTGGKQYLVQEGDALQIEKLMGDLGKQLVLDDVLLLVDDNGQARIAPQELKEVKVKAKLADRLRGDKKIGLKYKSKARYRRKYGHRQELSRIKITRIER